MMELFEPSQNVITSQNSISQMFDIEILTHLPLNESSVKKFFNGKLAFDHHRMPYINVPDEKFKVFI